MTYRQPETCPRCRGAVRQLWDRRGGALDADRELGGLEADMKALREKEKMQ